ncbi:MAG: nitroreductase family deazaflavin-dependent oxidoreductase [Armatimonadota bacterium]|nr:nitroreductase family deazaflavin-dependent oxidoreductase [Armatimonadota bacterium]MDR7467351.1 nitroreductase family deazaflavin-dependent oxidoreductase [Armatimonadota bacterium]MDR7494121.1 nitroreductase family deazaflavin-dependent oxidoreductase [Armatimonadota bacterium]MDR7498913.1 nitroreductase family deazaflavin-dependent oxidoreductase [Armatimonadota bacterium]MDR7504378.1 nitroreductase family deazaflavin-dependent oxidoreductase [Armatimonadota bacterium]
MRRRAGRRLAALAWRLHRWIYRTSGGRLGGCIAGMPVLLLATMDRHTGRRRETVLTFLRDGDDLVVIASNGGAPRHPRWLLNLRAHPAAEVRLGGRRIPVRTREATGPERERLWARAVQTYRGYAVYQARTSRRIPVVLLSPGAPSPKRVYP